MVDAPLTTNTDRLSPAGSDRPWVLFVGAFSKPADGTRGGQLFACQSLLESPLSEYLQWRLLDSTQKSLPPPPMWRRAFSALRRMIVFLATLLFKRVDTVLIFSSFRIVSLAEKMLMATVAGVLGKQVVIAFRSEIRPLGRGFKWIKPLVRVALKRTHAVICQSPLARERLDELFPNCCRCVEVVPNWIDLRPYTAIQRSRTEREDTDTIRLAFVGWLEKNKAVDVILEAVAQLVEQGHSIKLDIGGSGSEHSNLKAQANELGIRQLVEFRGWVSGEDKQDLFRHADIFVLPSYSEGMPNALLEAMASGLPIVATAVGGIPHLVSDRQRPLLIDPGSVPQLAQALVQLIEDPELRKQLVNENGAKVKSDHDVCHAWQTIGNLLGATASNASALPSGEKTVA